MSPQSRPLVRESGDWILNTIKRNPEGLLLLAAGAVLMLRTGTILSRDVPQDDFEGPAKSGPAEAASKVAEAVTNTTQRASSPTR